VREAIDDTFVLAPPPWSCMCFTAALGGQPHGSYVDIHDLLPVRLIQICGAGVTIAHPDIVDQRIYPAHESSGLSNQPGAVRRDLNIGDDRVSLAAVASDALYRCPSPLIDDIDGARLSSFSRQQGCDGVAIAGQFAGLLTRSDDYDLLALSDLPLSSSVFISTPEAE
jgi:hypothetical protein